MVYNILSNWHLFSTNGAFTSGTKKKVAVCHLSTSATASSSCKVRVIYEALFCHTGRAALCSNVSKNPIRLPEFSPFANGADLNRQKYAILKTHGIKIGL